MGKTALSAIVMALAAAAGGCSLVPPATKEEVAKADKAGVAYTQPYEKRKLPALPAEPGYSDYLERAFLANGDLEAAYFEWRAALERVTMAGAYPNSNVQLGFDYMFSRESMKAWNRTTISASFDQAMMLKLPQKVQEAAKVALAEAQATGLKFEQLKFEIQRKVLGAYLDYALMAEELRLADENLRVLKLLSETAANRLRAGGSQQDLVKAQTQVRMAEADRVSMQAKLSAMGAMLAGMVALPPENPLPVPKALPKPRPMPADDWRILAVAVDLNRDLASLAKRVEGRRDAVTLAKLAYFPDINPSAAFTGNVSQAVGMMVSIPTNLPMIEAQIRESKAMLASSEAMLRQAKADRAAQVVAMLITARQAEAQTKLLQEAVLPGTRRALDLTRQTYVAGGASFVELLDAQRTLLEVRRTIAQAQIAHDKALAELECLVCVDLETLNDKLKVPKLKVPKE